MKKIFSLTLILLFAFLNVNGQRTIPNFKIKNVPLGSIEDSILVYSNDRLVKRIAKSILLANYATKPWVNSLISSNSSSAILSDGNTPSLSNGISGSEIRELIGVESLNDFAIHRNYVQQGFLSTEGINFVEGDGITISIFTSRSGRKDVLISSDSDGKPTINTAIIDDNSTPVLANGITASEIRELLGVGEKRDFHSFLDFEDVRTVATYTISPTDEGNVLPFSNSAITVTINADSLSSVGDVVYLEYEGTGKLTIAAGTAILHVNASRKLESDGQYSRVAIHKKNANTYRVFGELAAN